MQCRVRGNESVKNIAVHTPDKTNFPNIALMKLSAWHKSQGDSVEWFNALFQEKYDVIYSSKVFTFTQDDGRLPDRAIKGGTGYGVMSFLPDEVEHIKPDYSLYPNCDFAAGFLTRGCIRKCPWCVVPKKEGGIKRHAHFEEFERDDTNKIVFMDNNPLACNHGLAEIERLAGTKFRVDFNQGLDARLIAADETIAEMLASLKWYKPVRLACDQKSQMESVGKAVKFLRKHGCKPKNYFCYVLVKDIPDALERVEFLRNIGVDPFAQPYRDFENNTQPTREQKKFARWVNHKAMFKSVKWEDVR